MSNYFITTKSGTKVDVSQIFLKGTPASTNYDIVNTYYKNFGQYQLPDGTISQQGSCGYKISGQDIGSKVSAFYYGYTVGTSYTFTPPEWCNTLNILMVGAGGGGGGGSVITNFLNDNPNVSGTGNSFNFAGKGGGGGGGGFAYISIPASTCSITVGGGGSGGLGGQSSISMNGLVPYGVKGGDGGATTLSVSGKQIICNGGVGGQGGTYDFVNNLNFNGLGGSSGTITGSTAYNNSGSSGSGNPTLFIHLLTVNGNLEGRYVSLGGNSGYTTNGGQFPAAILNVGGGGGNGGYPNVVTDGNNPFAKGIAGINGQDGYVRIYCLR